MKDQKKKENVVILLADKGISTVLVCACAGIETLSQPDLLLFLAIFFPL